MRKAKVGDIVRVCAHSSSDDAVTCHLNDTLLLIVLLPGMPDSCGYYGAKHLDGSDIYYPGPDSLLNGNGTLRLRSKAFEVVT